jgi:hypothetical protein
LEAKTGLSSIRTSVGRGRGRVGRPRPPRTSAGQHVVRHSTRRSALADGMANGHSAPRLGWQSANHLLDQSLGTEPLQNHYKTKPSAQPSASGRPTRTFVRTPDMSGRRLSDVIFPKDAQSDNPEQKTTFKKKMLF